jgi:hypothetical protein
MIKTSLLLLIFISLFAQENYWQQEIKYDINFHLDVETNNFSGTEKITYFNNSPDTLQKVFFHLYFNAFQPGSMMDVRSRTIPDPDRRVEDRILHLKEDEIGKQVILSAKQDGENLFFTTEGTVLEILLKKPILPNTSTNFQLKFEGQVPVQIRRSGRDNHEGIKFSMTQWYPKMAEYDEMGWHTEPYIGREFHGVWGNFDVKITLDSKYIIGGTGYLQNADEIGYGYTDKKVDHSGKDKLTWHFYAPNVHDFAFAADPDYTHIRHETDLGTTLHFFYKKSPATKHWESLPVFTEKALRMINKMSGKYPFKQYTVIQGGDGGMEYPMTTLITGKREIKSLVGVTIHELVHAWYQHILATNESLYPWMDEGFNEYITNTVMEKLFPSFKNLPFQEPYKEYFNLVESGDEEPLSTHADHFKTNKAYTISSYRKGEVYLRQLAYIIGEKNLAKTLLKYFDVWKYKHPTPNRFLRIAEKISCMELDWYNQYFVNTTYTIDYGIKSVSENNKTTTVLLEKIQQIPMPLDILVTLKNGEKKQYYIPLRIMRGEKPNENTKIKRKILSDWAWTHPLYEFSIDEDLDDIKTIEIDPSRRMADIERDNNLYKKSFWGFLKYW